MGDPENTGIAVEIAFVSRTGDTFGFAATFRLSRRINSTSGLMTHLKVAIEL